MSDVEKIKRDLRSLLSEYRYLHSLRVAEVAKGLAACYSYDIEKAYATGLVHDIAKEFSDEENRDIVSKYHLPIELLDKNYRKMLHADIGAVIAKNVYGFDDEACHAILSHAIGNIPMNLLDKIIFVADKIEPCKVYEGIELERKMASHDLNQAMIMCIENNHKKLVREKKYIHPRSIEVLNYLKNKNKDDVAC